MAPSPERINRVTSIAQKLDDHGNQGIPGYLGDMEVRIETVEQAVKDQEKRLNEISGNPMDVAEQIARNILKDIRGEDGKTPTTEELVAIMKPLIPAAIAGKTPTTEELLALIKPLIPKIVDGKTPTTEELMALIAPLIPVIKEVKIDESAIASSVAKIVEGNLPALGFAIRDSLELLEGDDRLDAKYIKNLPTFERGKVPEMSAAGSRFLYNLFDVSIISPTNGQTLVYNSTTGLWANGAGGGGGSGTPGGSNTQVQFNDSGSFGGSAKYVFNKTTGALTLGDGTSNNGNITLKSNSGANYIVDIASSSSSTDSGYFQSNRSRGTIASRTIVQTGDTLGAYLAYGYDGANLQPGGYFTFMASGTIAAGAMPSSFGLYLSPASSVTPALALGVLPTKELDIYGQVIQQTTSNGYSRWGTSVPNNTVLSTAGSAMELWANVSSDTVAPQIQAANASSGTAAFSGFCINNDLAISGDFTHFGGLFLNSSGYSSTTFGTAIAVPNLLQLENTDGPIAYASVTNSGGHIWYVGNTNIGGFATVSTANEIMRLTTTGLGIYVTNPLTGFEYAEQTTGTVRGILTGQYSTGTSSSRILLRKARGTRTSPTTVVTGDNLGALVFEGYDGSNYLQMGNIIVQSEGTIAATRIPTNMKFQTATNAAPSVLTTALTIDSAQLVTLGTAGSLTGKLAFAGVTSGTVTVQPASAAGTWTLTLPTTAGTANYFLQTNGSGVTTWAAGGGGITISSTAITSGTDTRVLFDDAGVVGESANMTFVKATAALTLGLAGTTQGQLSLAGVTSGSTTLKGQAVGGSGVVTFAASGANVFTFPASTSTLASLELAENFTGIKAFVPTLRTSGFAQYFNITAPADTAQTATTEGVGVNFNLSATRQWGTGTLATQREFLIQAPTYGFVGASTLTFASTVQISGFPIAGTNATITGAHALSFGVAPKGSATSCLVNLGAANIASGSASGTYLGVNPSSFSGDYIRLQNNGTNEFVVSSAGAITQNGKTTTYNGVATAGWGVPAIYASARATGQTAANASVATYTCGAADGSFLVSANVLVTTSSAESFTVTVSYTDEGNTARTLTLNFQTIAGTVGTTIAFANGAVPYEGLPTHLRVKASTAITIKTAAGGTYTGCTYNVEGFISQIA